MINYVTCVDFCTTALVASCLFVIKLLNHIGLNTEKWLNEAAEAKSPFEVKSRVRMHVSVTGKCAKEMSFVNVNGIFHRML